MPMKLEYQMEKETQENIAMKKRSRKIGLYFLDAAIASL